MTLNRESNKIFITETQTLKRFILSTFQGSQSTAKRDWLKLVIYISDSLTTYL